MKTVRVLLFLPGLAALAWGAKLFADYAFPIRPDVLATLTWLVGGPILHDAVIAPVVALAGLALSRAVPPAWRTAVIAGTVLTGILAILAVPLLWRTYGTPPSPGLHDGNPTLGLILTLIAIWALLAVATLARHRLAHRVPRLHR